jgi:hypothetical protein
VRSIRAVSNLFSGFYFYGGCMYVVSKDLVLVVLSLGLLVCVGRRGLLDSLEQSVLEVELADVGDGAALDGVVGELGSAVADDGYSYPVLLV